MKLLDTVSSVLKSLKDHWKTPADGRYMSNKEILSLSVGGIGVKFIVYCINQMILSVGNTLIGNTIGIDPTAIYVIYIISLLSSFPLTGIRARMIDNTRSMKGKYRPYIISMGIPTVLLGTAFILMPYERMNLVMKCVVVLAFNIGFQFFYNFMNDSYDSLINVLSPNSIERSDVLSIRSVVENISPSIANIFLPLVARLITGDNTLYDLRIYRVLFPPMLFVGFLISILAYVNTEEKIVQAKTHIIQVKFIDALRAVARNKYFWVISLAGWLGFLESAFSSIMGWMYNYQGACSAAQYSLITAIAGNASFWPNLVAPFFIRKYGKKKIMVFTNLLNIIFIALMLPIVRMTGSSGIIWLLLVCTFVNQFISSLGHLLTPSINADIRDYQQYVTGERIDGMFAAVGLIGNVITMATSSVLPALYERSGLNQATAIALGYDGSNVYNVLYNHDYFVRISSVLIIASVVGAVMNVIPMFFYDLTETKQKAMVKVLKIRALFEDYGNHSQTDEQLTETVGIIREAEAFADKTPQPLTRDGIEKAKKTKNKDAIKKAKQAYKKQKEENEKIEIAQFVVAELHRFETEEGKADIAIAEEIANAGLQGFLQIESLTKARAKAMPKTTQEEKERRRSALAQVQSLKSARKTAVKYFPDGIVEFDSSVFSELFAAEDRIEQELHDALKSMKTAKEKGTDLPLLKETVRKLQKEKAKVKADIKKATDEDSVYYRAAKPYLDAKKLLLQKENYRHYDEIEALYDRTVAASTNA